jgi:hypothetical protein
MVPSYIDLCSKVVYKHDSEKGHHIDMKEQQFKSQPITS